MGIKTAQALSAIPTIQRTEGRKKFFHYMFTTAMEGGIGYWSMADEYHWCKKNAGEQTGPSTYTLHTEDDLDGFYAIITSNEDDWGINYAYISEVGAFAIMPEECQNQPLRIDIDVIERGWNMFMNKVIEATKSERPEQEFSNPYFRQAIVQYLTDMEDGDSDADVADLVVQLGLFREHVYA